jgi:hypothetical protein
VLQGEVLGLSAGAVRLKAEGEIVTGIWLFQISSRGTVCDSAVAIRFCNLCPSIELPIGTRQLLGLNLKNLEIYFYQDLHFSSVL